MTFTTLLFDSGVCLPFINKNALNLKKNLKSNREKIKIEGEQILRLVPEKKSARTIKRPMENFWTFFNYRISLMLFEFQECFFFELINLETSGSMVNFFILLWVQKNHVYFHVFYTSRKFTSFKFLLFDKGFFLSFNKENELNLKRNNKSTREKSNLSLKKELIPEKKITTYIGENHLFLCFKCWIAGLLNDLTKECCLQPLKKRYISFLIISLVTTKVDA